MSDAATLRDTPGEKSRVSACKFSSVRKKARATGALILVALLLASCGDAAAPAPTPTGPRRTLDLSGAGWQLWLDRAASWEQDELFAPPVELAKVPVNEPTGGWTALAAAKSDRWDVSVPATVEQYAWDTLAAERRAAGEKAADDPISGDYVGVSWWWREFEVPAAELSPVTAAGRRHALLHVGAARLRAEVFVNRQIAGYDHPDVLMTGVETRTSSPIRITRGQDFQSLNVVGLFPAGEGAGYAGGIMSAGVDGIEVAEALGAALLAS